MLLYFVYGALLFMGMGFYISDCHLVVYKGVRDRYSRVKRLGGAVALYNKNFAVVLIKIFMILLQVLYLSIIQRMYNPVKKINNNEFEVTYVIKGKMYKMVVRPRLGPPPVLQISNENGEDVTDIVLPYMGPRYDWNGRNFSPSFFNCNSLTFEFYDATEITFTQDTPLNLSRDS